LEFIKSVFEPVVGSRPVKVHRAALVVSVEPHERAPRDSRTIGDGVLALATSETCKRLASFEEVLSIDMETSILVDIEPTWWAAGPGASLLGGPNPGLNTLELLLVFDFGEVAHDVGNHGVDGSLESRIIDVDREADVERLDGCFSLHAMLDEPMDLTGPETREPREFVDDHEIVLVSLDSIVEVTVLLTTLFAGPGDDIRVYVDVLDIRELRGDVFAALVKLSLDVLVLGTDAGVDGS